MGSKPEPAIWSRDTGQRISWYDSCQLHIICMSNINDICCNPRLHDLVLAGWPPCCATSFVVVVVGRTRPWSMPLAILTIRKELHGFLFLCIRVVPFSIIMELRHNQIHLYQLSATVVITIGVLRKSCCLLCFNARKWKTKRDKPGRGGDI